MLRRSPILAAYAAALPLLAGCSSVRSRFATHDDMFPPVPISLGEPRVVEGDTAWTLSGRGFELASRRRDALEPASTALESAAIGYRRFFARDPQPVVLVTLRERDAKPAADSALRSLAAGRTVVTLPAPPTAEEQEEAMRDRDAVMVRRGWSVAPVIRAWMGAQNGAPNWLALALLDIVGESPDHDMMVSLLALQADRAMPLAEFLAAPVPSTTPRDSAAPGGAERASSTNGAGERARRGPPPREARDGRSGVPQLSGARLYRAQALAMTQFLIVREGPEFAGRVADALRSGRPLEAALEGATSVPRTTAEFERAWKAWLATQRFEREGRRGR